MRGPETIAWLIAILASLTDGGCSISLPRGLGNVESITGYVAKNDTKRVFLGSTPGIDLRLSGDWSGVNVGWSEFAEYQVAVTSKRSSTAVRGGHYASPLGWTWQTADGTQRWIGWVIVTRPLGGGTTFVHHFYVGIGLGFSPLMEGIQLGAGRFTVLRAEPSESGTYVLNYNSHDPASGFLMRTSGEENVHE